MEPIQNFLSAHQISFKDGCMFSELTTFKIGGRSELVLYPETAEQCSALIRFAREQNQRLIFLGNGSNILGSDHGCQEWILKTERLAGLSIDENDILKVGAGVRLVKASSFTAKNGFSGLEFAYGIPGTVGGAVFMNAGAYGGSMDQVVLKTHYLDEEGAPHVIEGPAHQFAYRNSFFMQHPSYLITAVEMRLEKGNMQEILKRIEELQRRRKEKQPLEYPSAGSVFKRPAGNYAGKLIEEAGLRGYRIGDAQVSEKHCGFIINRGRATSRDVRLLIAHVQQQVKKKSGIELECEVRFIGAE